jgi:hypothetical protein
MTKSKTSKRARYNYFLIVIWNIVIFGLILVVVEGCELHAFCPRYYGDLSCSRATAYQI